MIEPPAQEPPEIEEPPKDRKRRRVPKWRVAIAGAALIGVVAGAGITEGANLLTETTPHSEIVAGQVHCASFRGPPKDVRGMLFQTDNGSTFPARLEQLPTMSGSYTGWDHFSINIPASAGGASGYVINVICARQSDWSSRMTGPASITMICGEVDGECSSIVTNPAATTITPAHPPYQIGAPGQLHPEQPHTPEPTHRTSQPQQPGTSSQTASSR
jgi:hypothetical protein